MRHDLSSRDPPDNKSRRKAATDEALRHPVRIHTFNSFSVEADSLPEGCYLYGALSICLVVWLSVLPPMLATHIYTCTITHTNVHKTPTVILEHTLKHPQKYTPPQIKTQQHTHATEAHLHPTQSPQHTHAPPPPDFDPDPSADSVRRHPPTAAQRRPGRGSTHDPLHCRLLEALHL